MLKPFFILGNPRSGTSLFRIMLNSHPRIVVPPESGFLQWWYSKYKNWTKEDSKSIIHVEKYIEDILTSKKIEHWDLDKEKLIKSVLLHEPANYGELSSIIYSSYKNNSGLEISIIGDKNNYYIDHLKILDEIYPETCYIHLIRDGRDVACSYKEMKLIETKSEYKPKLPQDISVIARQWNTNIEKIDTFIENKCSLKIRYEDLLIEPKETLIRVCDFLKVPFHSLMLNYYKNNLNDEPIGIKDWKMKTFEPIDSSNIKKYSNILTQKEIAEFNSICKNRLMLNHYY